MKQKYARVHKGTAQEPRTDRMKTGVKQWIREFQQHELYHPEYNFSLEVGK